MEVKITKDGDQFVVSDEGGEFARASSVELTLPYVRDLLYGPGTTEITLGGRVHANAVRDYKQRGWLAP